MPCTTGISAVVLLPSVKPPMVLTATRSLLVAEIPNKGGQSSRPTSPTKACTTKPAVSDLTAVSVFQDETRYPRQGTARHGTITNQTFSCQIVGTTHANDAEVATLPERALKMDHKSVIFSINTYLRHITLSFLSYMSCMDAS